MQTRRWWASALTALALVAAVMAGALVGAPAAAAGDVITVTTTADVTDPNDGLLSLREAVALSNTQVGDDTIVLAASATYALTQCPPLDAPVFLWFHEESTTVTIEGNGSTIRQDCVAGRAKDVPTIASDGTGLLLRSVTISLAGKGVLVRAGTGPNPPTFTMDHAAIVDAAGVCVDAYDGTKSVTMRFSRIDGCGDNGVRGPLSGRLFPLDIADSEIARTGTDPASNSWGAFVTTQLNLLRSTVHDNPGGGGIVSGPAVVTESHVDRNGGIDAGLFAVGTINATDSTFDDNVTTIPAGSGSGGIAGVTGAGTSTFTRVSASRNRSTAGAGHAGIGLFVGSYPTVMIDATIVDSHVDANQTVGTGTGRATSGVATLGTATTDVANRVRIDGTTVDDNVAPDNAGVFTTVPTTISASDVSGNSFLPGGSQQGAGAVVVLEHLTMSRSTVSQNATRHDPTFVIGGAGGVFARDADLDDTTISGNTGDVGGVTAYGSAALVHVTLADNSGSNARNLAAWRTISIAASAFSGAAQGAVPNCALLPSSGTITSGGFNVVSDETCPLTGAGTDVVGVGDLGLGSLASGGGVTLTRVPLAGSRLRDRIPVSVTALCGGVDQRGVVRPQGVGCDVGAVEAVGSRFHALAPTRILDSRVKGTAGFEGPVVAGAPRGLVVTGGSVPASAAAVVVNVTVTGSSANSFLTVWPDGVVQPNASAVNFAAGQTIPNLVTVMVGAGGKVAFATNQGATDVVVDLLGFYDDGSGVGDGWVGIDPVRVLDSRTATGGWGGRLAAGFPRPVTVAGVGAVPAGVSAVVANVTVTNGSANSFVTVWPAGQAKPSASSVNFAVGETTANAVVVPVGPGGVVAVANAVGATDVVIDVVGYFVSGSGGRFFAVGPTRVLDDRVGVGVSGPWLSGQTRAVPVGVPGVAGPVAGVAANVTVTNGSVGSFVAVFPHGGSVPVSSTVNFGPGQTKANQVMVKAEGGQVDIFNQLGTVDVIADVVGYYTPTS